MRICESSLLTDLKIFQSNNDSVEDVPSRFSFKKLKRQLRQFIQEVRQDAWFN